MYPDCIGFLRVSFLHMSGNWKFGVLGAEELRLLLPRGLEVLGAVDLGQVEGGSLRAGSIALKLRKELQLPVNGCIVAAPSSGSSSFKLEYSWYEAGNQSSLQALNVQEFEGSPWEETTFFRCQLHLSLPLYLSQTATASGIYSQFVSLLINCNCKI